MGRNNDIRYFLSTQSVTLICVPGCVTHSHARARTRHLTYWRTRIKAEEPRTVDLIAARLKDRNFIPTSHTFKIAVEVTMPPSSPLHWQHSGSQRCYLRIYCRQRRKTCTQWPSPRGGRWRVLAAKATSTLLFLLKG